LALTERLIAAMKACYFPLLREILRLALGFLQSTKQINLKSYGIKELNITAKIDTTTITKQKTFTHLSKFASLSVSAKRLSRDMRGDCFQLFGGMTKPDEGFLPRKILSKLEKFGKSTKKGSNHHPTPIEQL
jgi:hypothetical protein